MPFKVSDLNKPNIAGQYWPMYDYAERYIKGKYLMAMSLVVMLTEIITMLKSFKQIENFLLSIERSWSVVYACVLILGLWILGLSLCNMVQYSQMSLKYHNLGTAMLYTIYSPDFLVYRPEFNLALF